MADKSRSDIDGDVERELDPKGEHDPEAVKDVARKMGIDHPASDKATPSDDDPTGEHDPEALKDVARKMGLER
jgi:hypothetical protein